MACRRSPSAATLRVGPAHLVEGVLIQGRRAGIRQRPRNPLAFQPSGEAGGLEGCPFIDAVVGVDLGDQPELDPVPVGAEALQQRTGSIGMPVASIWATAAA